MSRLTAPSRRLLTAVAAASFAIAALTACSSPPDSDEAGSVTDTHAVETHYGEVEVPVEPQRIVAVSYDTPWQLMSLGVTPVGAQDYSNFLASFDDDRKDFIADVAPVGTYGEIDYEAVLALDPDLIVGDAYEIDEEIYEKLTEIAPTAIVFGENRADWKTVVADLAAAVGADESLDDAKAAYDDRMSELQETYADVLAENTFAPTTFGNQEVEFSIMYPTGVVGSIYDELGVTYAPGIPDGDFEAGYESYPYERIPEILGEADVIVAPSQNDGTDYEALQTLFDNSLFASLPAAVDGHVYRFPMGVTDYVSATAYLDQIEENVLSVLAR